MRICDIEAFIHGYVVRDCIFGYAIRNFLSSRILRQICEAILPAIFRGYNLAVLFGAIRF